MDLNDKRAVFRSYKIDDSASTLDHQVRPGRVGDDHNGFEFRIDARRAALDKNPLAFGCVE